MTTENEHTGQKQQTKPSSDAYREGWDRIFGKLEEIKEIVKEKAPLAQ